MKLLFDRLVFIRLEVGSILRTEERWVMPRSRQVCWREFVPGSASMFSLRRWIGVSLSQHFLPADFHLLSYSIANCCAIN
jgi:hypothetical protein